MEDWLIFVVQFVRVRDSSILRIDSSSNWNTV
jgi:hypothetical protein